MQWELVTKGQVQLSLRVDPEFLDWLRPRVADSDVAQLDPYRDSTLDLAAQERWIAALRGAYEGLLTEIRASVERHHHLPHDSETYELIVHKLIERELSRNRWAGLLGNLTAALELSHENCAIIRILGD